MENRSTNSRSSPQRFMDLTAKSSGSPFLEQNVHLAGPRHMHNASYSFGHHRNFSAGLQSPTMVSPRILGLDLETYMRGGQTPHLNAVVSTTFGPLCRLGSTMNNNNNDPMHAGSDDPAESTPSAADGANHVSVIAIGTPGPMVLSPYTNAGISAALPAPLTTGISTGLTPFLRGGTPYLGRQSQPSSAWLHPFEFQWPGDRSPTNLLPKLEPEKRPIEEAENEPKRQKLDATGLGVSIGDAEPQSSHDHSIDPQLGDTEPQDEDNLMDVPGDDYCETTKKYKWQAEDDQELINLLENAEKYKWSYISDRMFDKMKKRIPAIACQRKFKDLWGIPESSTHLDSSLPYIAYRSGYRSFKDLRASTELDVELTDD